MPQVTANYDPDPVTFHPPPAANPSPARSNRSGSKSNPSNRSRPSHAESYDVTPRSESPNVTQTNNNATPGGGARGTKALRPPRPRLSENAM